MDFDFCDALPGHGLATKGKGMDACIRVGLPFGAMARRLFSIMTIMAKPVQWDTGIRDGKGGAIIRHYVKQLLAPCHRAVGQDCRVALPGRAP